MTAEGHLLPNNQRVQRLLRGSCQGAVFQSDSGVVSVLVTGARLLTSVHRRRKGAVSTVALRDSRCMM